MEGAIVVLWPQIVFIKSSGLPIVVAATISRPFRVFFVLVIAVDFGRDPIGICNIFDSFQQVVTE